MPLGTDSQGGRYVVSPLQVQIHRILRRLWLVVLIATLAVGGVVALTLTQETSYTGKAALTIASENRAPEQDAVLAQGYADYFNQKSYQDVLAAGTGIGPGATYAARTAASSPIVYVEVTTSDPETAQTAAAALAQAFQDDVNANLAADTERTVADLREQVVAESGRLQGLGLSEDDRSLATEQILSLRDRITEIQSDTSNQLKELQFNAGVSSSSPDVVLNALLALVGGTVLGGVAALGLATFDKARATADNVQERLGLHTLAVVETRGGTGTDKGVQRLKGLANVVGLRQLPTPTTIAIVSPRAASSTAMVAHSLASYRAVQGQRTILLRTDVRHARRGETGVANLLTAGFTTRLDGYVTLGWRNGMLVVPPGTAQEDSYALFTRDRVRELIGKAADISDLVVIEAPPLVDAAEAQVVCAVADHTILVLDGGLTTMADAAEAVELLAQVGGTLLGAVIVQTHPAQSTTTPTQVPADEATANDAGRVPEPLDKAASDTIRLPTAAATGAGRDAAGFGKNYPPTDQHTQR